MQVDVTKSWSSASSSGPVQVKRRALVLQNTVLRTRLQVLSAAGQREDKDLFIRMAFTRAISQAFSQPASL